MEETNIADGSNVCVSMSTDWLLQAERTHLSSHAVLHGKHVQPSSAHNHASGSAELCLELKANVSVHSDNGNTLTAVMFPVFIILIRSNMQIG